MLVVAAILLFLLGSLFFMANSFQKTTTKAAGQELLEGVFQQTENGLLELKVLSSQTTGNSTIVVRIPELMGEQRYLVSGLNGTIKIRSFGDPSIVIEHEIRFWNATLRGSVFSSKGKIEIEFVPADNTVTFK